MPSRKPSMTSSSLRLIWTPSEQRKNVKHKNILWLQLKPLVANPVDKILCTDSLTHALEKKLKKVRLARIWLRKSQSRVFKIHPLTNGRDALFAQMQRRTRDWWSLSDGRRLLMWVLEGSSCKHRNATYDTVSSILKVELGLRKRAWYQQGLELD